MAYIEGRVQSATSGGGIAYAFIKDNFNNTGNCDAYGLFYSFYAYFPGYQITASSASFITKTHEITSTEWANKFMTIRLDPKPPSTSCFTGETKILMADGSNRRIDEIDAGDIVAGPRGKFSKVVGVERPLLGDRLLYGLNGSRPFVTSEHPFMTSDGWKSIDPTATAAENERLRVTPLRFGDQLLVRGADRGSSATSAMTGNLALAIYFEEVLRLEPVSKIIPVAADPAIPVYNLLLEGDHCYFAGGYLVHNKGGGW